MYNLQEKICLVIPCYNESKRLDFKEFSNCGENVFFLFVNDCSTDNTLDVLKKNLNKNTFLLDLEKNVGKGEAVRRGMVYLKTLPVFNEIKWVGYWDADLATPLKELDNFILFKNTFYPEAIAIFGSRVLRMGSSIKRSFFRNVMGRLFATLVGLTLGITSYDSQCGSKLFLKSAIDKYFNEPFVSRWIFDVEILLRMKQKDICEYPLKEWNDISGSSLKVHSVAFSVLRDVIKLRKKYIKS